MSRRHMSTKAPNVKLRPAPARALSHTEGTIQQGSASRSGSIKGKERALDEDATKDDADTSFDITHAVVDDKPLRDVVVCMTGIKDGRVGLLRQTPVMPHLMCLNNRANCKRWHRL